jgi:hypothetical protein
LKVWRIDQPIGRTEAPHEQTLRAAERNKSVPRSSRHRVPMRHCVEWGVSAKPAD